MSEKTLTELIETRIDMEGWHVPRQGQRPFTAMFDARIRRAEAAERVAEAWLAWCDNCIVEGTWDAFKSAVAEYKAAREAVRKLEGTT